MHDGSQLRKPVWLPAWERKAFIYSGWSLIIILPEGGEKWWVLEKKKNNSEIIFLVTHLPDTTQRLLALRHRSLCCFILFPTKYLKIGEGRR